ncbi:SDR family oxidoreductase [Peterkaempfera bronchialis]|uniref:SDR family NAD(P)-dependent oxidoreductase n=1 Tax=Peterkaempfera bronchialis TaxID=2126346 RepID=A0A345SRD5_9ACTN|nr:SDR family oxidoreductase [Peterkaempfera bronchialis]AXI76290.1 SDR family NAD(P)-dependent oxidoreductase [Peterkaempfera bronchialis]
MVEAQGPLSGRVVVVTGGGRGIGREHALAFARAGAAVVVNDLGGAGDGTGSSSGPAQEVAELIRSEGGAAVANSDDVSDEQGSARIVEQAVEEFGGLHVLVNNAGILRDKTLLNMDFEEWDSVVRVHLRGTFAMTRAAGRFWRDQAKAGKPVVGRVVNTSSGSGLFGNFGQSNYGAAKGGIASFTIIAAMELARYGVTVNAIAPVAKTRLTATAGMSLDIEEGFDPLAPQHVSPFVVWLGSERSGGVTGRVFSVVGGYVGVAEGWRIGSSLQVDGPLTFEAIEERFPAVFEKAAGNVSVFDSHPYGPQEG